MWVFYLFSYLDHPFIAYFITSVTQGMLALQLIGNHYWKPFVEVYDAKYCSFPQRQVEVNVNYKCSRWIDWHYGGLHFHNEHHAFPCMPRYHLRLIAPDLKKLMKKHGVEYEYDWFTNVLWNMNGHLKKVAKMYRERPRAHAR